MSKQEWSDEWGHADRLLREAQEIVQKLKGQNTDDYGLLQSAHEHIIAARSDLEDDLK